MNKERKAIGHIRDNLLYLIMVMQPLLDIIAYFQEGSSISVAGYIRLAITIVIPVYTLFVTEKKKRFFVAMCVIAFVCVCHVINGFRVGYISMFADVKYLLLVVHMPILFYSFIHLFEKESILDQLQRGLKVNIIVILIAFYASYTLKNGNFTYSAAKEGWTGWYVVPNAQSIIISCLLPFVLFFVIKCYKKWFPIPMVAVILMHIMNGTRSAYLSLLLGIFCVFAFYVFEYIVKREGKFPFYTVSMLLLCLVVAVSMYNFSPRSDVDEYAKSERAEEQQELEALEQLSQQDSDKSKLEAWILKNINPLLLDRFGKERVMAAYGEDATATDYADMRLKKLIYGQLVWEEQDSITKLVGFQYPEMQHKGENFDLENDPQAILFYYGYIGAAAYAALLVYFLIRLVKQLCVSFRESLNVFNFCILISFILQLGLCAYTGYVLRRPNVSIYLMVTLLLIYCQTGSLRKRKE